MKTPEIQRAGEFVMRSMDQSTHLLKRIPKTAVRAGGFIYVDRSFGDCDLHASVWRFRMCIVGDYWAYV